MQVFIRQALAASLGLAAAHAGAQSSVSILKGGEIKKEGEMRYLGFGGT